MRWVGLNSILDEMNYFKYAVYNIFLVIQIMSRWICFGLFIMGCIGVQSFDIYVLGKTPDFAIKVCAD